MEGQKNTKALIMLHADVPSLSIDQDCGNTGQIEEARVRQIFGRRGSRQDNEPSKLIMDDALFTSLKKFISRMDIVDSARTVILVVLVDTGKLWDAH